MEESTEVDPPTRSRWDDRGASLVEYSLLVALIALVCAAALGYFQDEVQQSFSHSASAVAEAGQ